MLRIIHPQEGDVYKIFEVGGKTIVVRYGYYSDAERTTGDLIPVFPDLRTDPLYDDDGRAIVTRIQDACDGYESRDGGEGDGWCADCRYYHSSKDEIAVCHYEGNRQRSPDIQEPMYIEG